MQSTAKTLILNNEKDNNFKAILDIKKFNNSMIRFFNMSKTSRALALGIKQDAKIIKIPLTINGGVSTFDLKDNLDLDKTFLCAVVDVSNPFCPEIVLSGSQNSKNENDNIECAFTQTKPQDTSSLYTNDCQKDIDDLIDKNLEDDMSSTYFDACAKCKYREAFYKEGGCFKSSQNIAESLNDKDKNINLDKKEPIIHNDDTLQSHQIQDNNYQYGKLNGDVSVNNYTNDGNDYLDEENLNKNNNENVVNDFSQTIEKVFKNSNEKEPDKEDKINQGEPTFYEQVKPQIDALFAKYEEYELLEKIIPNSKWSKIVYDKDGNYYVLGLLYNEIGEVVYICYGMPALSRNNPPDDLEDYAGYLPKDINNPDGEGYFIVCQDALTGKTLKVDLS